MTRRAQPPACRCPLSFFHSSHGAGRCCLVLVPWCSCWGQASIYAAAPHALAWYAEAGWGSCAAAAVASSADHPSTARRLWSSLSCLRRARWPSSLWSERAQVCGQSRRCEMVCRAQRPLDHSAPVRCLRLARRRHIGRGGCCSLGRCDLANQALRRCALGSWSPRRAAHRGVLHRCSGSSAQLTVLARDRDEGHGEGIPRTTR